MPRKLQILCFHGYYNNVEVARYQFDYYIHIFRESVDFHFINGPYECEDVFDTALYKMFAGGPFYGWIKNLRSGKSTGWKESVSRVVEYMNEHGPFDGVMGFS